jgi:hypothetical protein
VGVQRIAAAEMAPLERTMSALWVTAPALGH